MTKKILTAFILIFILVGLVFTLILVRQRQELRKQGSGGAGTTEVSLSPKTGTFSVNQAFTVGLFFNTKNLPIDTIQLIFDVNGAAVESINDQQIQGLKWQVKTVTQTTNGSQVKLLANATLGSTYTNNGSTLLANLNLKATQTGTSQITFNQQLSKILIAGQDLLLTPENGSYMITGATPTPTPTGSPTPTPSATPTPTPVPPDIAACWQQCTNDSQCGNGRICKEVSGQKRCLNPRCEGESDCVCNAGCYNPCGADNECDSGQVCRQTNNVTRCVNPSCSDKTNCSCVSASPQPTPQVPVTPKAGFFLPTAAAVLGGVLLLILGLTL